MSMGLEGGLLTKGLFKKKSLVDRPLVSIVTPVYNGERYLEETIESIIDQTYDNIEYLVIDGGSQDGTLEIIKSYEDKIAYWVSEPDRGMYDGINKGFKIATGDIFSWLNADDKYYRSAVEVVVRVFNRHPEIEWVTGIPTIYDKDGLITKVGVPLHYFREFISMGLYRGDILGWIQQESTFWRKSLMDRSGMLRANLQLAGDYELWVRFSKHSNLTTIPTVLGGFRKHSTQKSKDLSKYYDECDSVKNIKFKRMWRAMRYPVLFSSLMAALFRLYLSNNSIATESL
jgi:glycosyltransferase involved in cell wall biosynthesis